MQNNDELRAPEAGSRWVRPDYDPALGEYNGYTVLGTTNTAHRSDKHPAQVVYRGDNGNLWSLPLASWPGSLTRERSQPEKTTGIIRNEDLEGL